MSSYDERDDYNHNDEEERFDLLLELLNVENDTETVGALSVGQRLLASALEWESGQLALVACSMDDVRTVDCNHFECTIDNIVVKLAPSQGLNQLQY